VNGNGVATSYKDGGLDHDLTQEVSTKVAEDIKAKKAVDDGNEKG
jgi:hypothetical protein